MKLNGDKIFGYLDPRNTQCDLRDIFKGVTLTAGSRRQKRYDNRGSSEYWNDGSEFATPLITKQLEAQEVSENSSLNIC